MDSIDFGVESEHEHFSESRLDEKGTTEREKEKVKNVFFSHLRAVGPGSRVGHREDARAGVLEREVLVGKLLAVDGLAARAVAAGKVAALVVF